LPPLILSPLSCLILPPLFHAIADAARFAAVSLLRAAAMMPDAAFFDAAAMRHTLFMLIYAAAYA